jgi:hypothetical protein
MIRRLLLLCAVIFALALSFALNAARADGQPDFSSNPRWILVTTAELASELEPLILRRQQQGFEVFKIYRNVQLPISDWNSEFIQNKISELCPGPSRSTYVLLVGQWNKGNELSYLPSGTGKHGRMQGARTDHAYGLPDAKGVPTIAVGRYPARNVEDVRQFVAKVIRYEDQTVGPWTNRLNLWIGHPGGNSAMEKRLGETIVQSAVSKSLSQLHLSWHGHCLIDFPNTPYSVDRKVFRDRIQSDLSQGQSFTIYAGHSGPEGIWSEDQFVFSRDEWTAVKIQSSPGVVLTTGCFACQMSGHNGNGFLAASMNNPQGPVACMGAYAESYAAHGQLALDAFVELVARPNPPVRLGDCWLSIAAGIGIQKMDPLTFWLYDQADGSRGAVPLDKQRLEHLEMWALLGDPALRIPFLAPTLDFDLKAEIGSTEVVVEFNVPESLIGGTCELQVQLRPGTQNRRAKSVKLAPPIVSSQQLNTKPQFTGTVVGLVPLTEGELRVRVLVLKDGQGALGVASKSLKQN